MDRASFVEVTDRKAIEKVAALAEKIWREYYIPLIGKGQVDYMLKKFQSPAAIQKQIAEQHYCYYLIQDKNGDPIGYFGFVLKDGELFLSKIYVKHECRGQGYAREAINFLEQIAADGHCSKITLTVNKGNLNTIVVYEKMGFLKVASIVQNIGNGFAMDDYKMEKLLNASK